MQIAEYVSGRRQRIVAHLGSAHTDVKLRVLMAQAQGVLAASPEDVPAGGRAVAETAAAGSVVATVSGLLFELLVGVYESSDSPSWTTRCSAAS